LSALFVCALWGLLCLLLFSLACPLCCRLLLLLLRLLPLLLVRLLGLLLFWLLLLLLWLGCLLGAVFLLLALPRLPRRWLLRTVALLLPVLVFLPRLLWLVVMSRPLPLFLLLRVLCLLSPLLTLVVWCALLVVCRSVACGLPWVVVRLLLPCPWLLLSGLLVLLVLRLTFGVLLVARVCLAPATSVLCLFVDRSSSPVPACAGAVVVVCLGLPVGAFALFLFGVCYVSSFLCSVCLRSFR
jgi:hypothetical protein